MSVEALRLTSLWRPESEPVLILHSSERIISTGLLDSTDVF